MFFWGKQAYFGLFLVFVLFLSVFASAKAEPSAESTNEIKDVSLKLAKFEKNNVYFSAEASRKQFGTLSKMFSEIQIGLECLPKKFGFLRMNSSVEKPEGVIECDGVSLSNFFENSEGSKIKQIITLTNNSSRAQKRIVSILLASDADKLETDEAMLKPTQKKEAIISRKSNVRFENSGDSDFKGVDLDFSVNSSIKFSNGGKFVGSYDWKDLLGTKYPTTTLTFSKNGKNYTQTLIEATIPANQTITLDPTYDLGTSTNYSASWNGGTANDQLGWSFSSGLGIQLVNADGGAFANDLLMTAVNADVNGKSNNGAIYLVKNVDGLSGIKDLNSPANFDALWNGGVASDQLGYTSNSGLGAQLVNADGGAFANDLLMTAYLADVNGKSNNGAVYLVKNIDLLSGVFDLNSSASFDVRWNGGVANDQLGSTTSSGLGVQLVSVDGGSYYNDLLLTAINADVNGKSNNGAVYLIKNVDGLSGIKDLNFQGNFDVRWNGSVANDQLGYTNGSSQGVQLVNADGGAFANDLLMTAINADVNGKTNNGAVYLVKNIDGISGVRDLGSSSNFDIIWNGGTTSDQLGYTNGSSQGVQLVNADGGAFANDLLMTAINADVNGKTDSGAVYLIKNVDGLSGIKDLNFQGNFDVRWNGDVASDQLGYTTSSGLGVQLVNIDGGSYYNDLILTASGADVNGKSNNGAVYLVKNIDLLSGVFDLNSSVSFDVRWNGGEATNDQLGYTSSSGSGVQLVNVDGGLYYNDLLLTAIAADINGIDGCGAVYLVKNIDGLSGIKDLNIQDNFDVRWNGASAIDQLGYAKALGVQLANVDGGSYVNDLLLTASYADVNGQVDNGAVYLVKNIDGLRGTKDLGSSSNFDVLFNGTTISDQLGYNNNSGQGVQLVNVDNETYSNDLLLTSINADINGNFSTGAVYLVKNIDGISGVRDLGSSSNFDIIWNGGASSDQLGFTSGSGQGVQLINVDGGVFTNDLLMTAINADVNGKTNNGAVYLVRNFITLAPDLNVVSIDGFSDSESMRFFSYVLDGNISIGFSVSDFDSNNLKLDINYSSWATPYTGTAIVVGVDLNSLPTSGPWNCSDTNFTDSTQCGIDWDISGVSDGNYFIHIVVSDGVNVDQNTVDRSFGIDNASPSISGIQPASNVSAFDTSPDFNFAVSDSGSGVGYCTITPIIDGVAQGDVNGTLSGGLCLYTSSVLGVGKKIKVRGYGVDNAGNVSASVDSAEFTISSPAGGRVSGGSYRGVETPENFTKSQNVTTAAGEIVVERNVTQTPIPKNVNYSYSFSIDVTNYSGKVMRNVVVSEFIPKEIVTDLRDVDFANPPSKVYESGLVEWIVPELAPGEKVEFKYSVKTLADKTIQRDFKSFFDSLAPVEVKADKAIEVDVCATLNCDDNDACTKDLCSNGKCVREEISNCGKPKGIEVGADLPLPRLPEKRSEWAFAGLTLGGIGVIVLSVLLLVAAYFMVKKPKKSENSQPLPKEEPIEEKPL